MILHHHVLIKISSSIASWYDPIMKLLKHCYSGKISRSFNTLGNWDTLLLSRVKISIPSMVLDTSIWSKQNMCSACTQHIFLTKEVDIWCCLLLDSAHLNLGAVCPVLARVLRPLVVPDLHQPRVKLRAAGLVTSGPALHPSWPRDLGNVGLGEVFLRNGSLPQPPGK